jgi:hypothetical protein
MVAKDKIFTFEVFGALNPFVHTKLWYEQNLDGLDIKNIEDFSNGYKNVPKQLTLDDLKVTCDFQHWSIASEDVGHVETLRQIVDRVFGEILIHTPLNGLQIRSSCLFEIEEKEKVQALINSAAPSNILIDSEPKLSGFNKTFWSVCSEGFEWGLKISTCGVSTHLHVDSYKRLAAEEDQKPFSFREKQSLVLSDIDKWYGNIDKQTLQILDTELNNGS